MRYFICTFLLILGTVTILRSQKVDSIRVEQTGDLIKVHYKILNSNPDQIFRVSVLCSINGGLKSQLNSLSGDFGENITGGRDGYLILWDVLKDIDELKSAEFFIKAELVKDLSAVTEANSVKPKIKGKIHVMPGFEIPGPKGTLRVGYMGSFGIAAQISFGKIPVTEEFKNNMYYDQFPPKAGAALDLTTRIINGPNFQMHLMAGYRNADFLVYYTGGAQPDFWRQGMDGLEFGMVFVIKRIAVCIASSQFSPKQLERKLDETVVLASPYKSIDLSVGMKF